MSRKKRHEEHANHERWLVSYADFITLLFAFFVVLYSSSQVDKRKIGQLAMAIQVAFQRMAVFDNSNTKVPLATSEPMPFQDVQAVENVSRTQDLERFIQPENGELSGSTLPHELKDIRGELEKALAPEIKRHVLEVSSRHEGLVISLREIGFFESGSATLRRSSMDALDRLASVLGPRDEMLRIEGHTDNVPIHTAQFASNWELSTARAIELIKVFILQYKFSPGRLAAAGYAEYHPVDSNDTPEGRAHNRRVDIVVLNPTAVAGTFRKTPALPRDPVTKPPSIAPPDLGRAGPN